MDFTDFTFKWTFRDYQQDVLDNAAKYLSDKQIHIVAAPGSGKTILGLELIRRLAAPALVLSPSVTIRQQWGERFAEAFMSDPSRVDEAVSFSLKAPKLITSVTYQALHAAYNKKISDEAEETDDEKTSHAEQEDYTAFDLLKTVKKAGIRTICLDEAHHLKSEWQRALEGFISAFNGEMTIIALTATPPYDSTAGEWNKYISICGEIDAEIFIPQLVKQKTLCPHQDYIYFSYPTKEETETLADFYGRASACVNEIIAGPSFKAAVSNSKVLQSYEGMEEQIFDNPDAFAALLTLAAKAGMTVPKKLVSMLAPDKAMQKFSLETAQTALGFIVQTPALFGEKEAAEIKAALHRQGFMNGSTPCLTGDKKIKKMLTSSMGKLAGINSIAAAECKDMGGALRMLILTDFIKKDALSLVGTDAVLNVMGTVPIFESVRRTVGDRAKIALLAGILVIVPNELIPAIQGIAARQGVEFKTKPLPNAPYSELIVAGSNKNKVSILTEAFEGGLINILIGTKSLLGEGWDSPCINALILASFVGSFMLSNQMRGRAIRTDKNKPDKTSNIWHLVTVEPQESVPQNDTIASDDYITLQRRFLGFLAPAYNGGTIESGIGRISNIRPPFDEAGFADINAETLRMASEREAMAGTWDAALGKFTRPQVSDTCEVPKKVQPKGVLLTNLLVVIFWVAVIVLLIVGLLAVPLFSDSTPLSVLAVIAAIAAGIFALLGFKKFLNFMSPAKTVKTLAGCLLKTMKKLGLIESKNARVAMRIAADGMAHCVLSAAGAHDNESFGKAMAEMLSAIGNPRYVMVQKRRLPPSLSYANSYACPAVIGANKENAQVLAQFLKKQAGNFELIYTRSAEGKKHLTKCRQKAYLNRNAVLLKRMKMVN